MKLDKQSGLLDCADIIPSPNYDQRPDPDAVSLIVVHGISLPPGEFGGQWITDFFTNQLDTDAHPYFAEIASLKVSSHFLIRRDGSIVQYVPVHDRAWHAGQSCFKDCPACNDYSIGIELEGEDNISYDDRQYGSLLSLINVLREHYPKIQPDHVVGHADIAPGRKTDPGEAFDWERVRNNLSSSLASSSRLQDT